MVFRQSTTIDRAGIEGEAVTTIVELITNGGVTLAAAFLGAYAAFKLESNNRKKQIEEQDVAAGNRALFTLTQIWSRLRQYQKEMIEEYRTREDAWLNLPAGMPIQDNGLTLDMNDLSFLLQSKPAIFQLIFLEADRFRLAAEMINQRNELVLSQVHPRMSAAGVRVGGAESFENMESILTIGVVHQLKVYTAGIIKNVDEDLISSFEAYERLRASLKEIYPNRKFLDFKRTS